MRLDRWFRAHFPDITYGHLQKLLRSGQVRVDSRRVQANARLEAGQQLRVPAMLRQRHGRIINVTSVVAETGNAGQANYVAAKAGLIGLTRAIATEVASRSITVNAVAPGFIDTDMTRALNEEQRAALTAQVPMARLGSVDDIAAAVLFLCGPGASYITGETLHVNGGMYMA